MRERVEEYLNRRRNKEYRDPKGGAGTKLAKAIKVNPGSLAAVLRQMEEEGVIERTGTERRTYTIRLLTEPEPAPATNGQQAVAAPKTDYLAKLNEAMSAGQAVLDALIKENEQLRKQLTKSEQKVGELQIEIAALKREAKDTRNSAQLIADIERKLAELKG
jgi:hypothetical protein